VLGEVKRGEIYLITLGEKVGSEQSGVRPLVILQNDIGNTYSTTTIGAVLSSSKHGDLLPTQVRICPRGKLKKESVIMTEQLSTISKDRLIKLVGSLTEEEMYDTERAVKISLGLEG